MQTSRFLRSISAVRIFARRARNPGDALSCTNADIYRAVQSLHCSLRQRHGFNREQCSGSPATIALSGTGVSTATHSVGLTWDASTSTVSGYNVYRSTTSGSGYIKVNSSLVGSLNFSDASVQSSTTYYYVTTAVDSSGNERPTRTRRKPSFPEAAHVLLCVANGRTCFRAERNNPQWNRTRSRSSRRARAEPRLPKLTWDQG